jgi:hypothetical protein
LVPGSSPGGPTNSEKAPVSDGRGFFCKLTCEEVLSSIKLSDESKKTPNDIDC